MSDSAVLTWAVLIREKYRNGTEITVHARGEKFLHGVGYTRTWETSLSLAIGKCAQKAQKVKGKCRSASAVARMALLRLPN